jgi:hypothetical protein
VDFVRGVYVGVGDGVLDLRHVWGSWVIATCWILVRLYRSLFVLYIRLVGVKKPNSSFRDGIRSVCISSCQCWCFAWNIAKLYTQDMRKRGKTC